MSSCPATFELEYRKSNERIFYFFSALDETCIRDEEVASEGVREAKDDHSSYNDVLVHKLKSRLAGVPPPPQFTYPQYTIEDMLQLLKNDEWINCPSHRTDGTGVFREKINCDQNVGETCPWPDVKECVYFDICYNIDKTTENLVNLCDVYRQRYVGCETSSFVTANSPSKYNGKKKERRKLIGRSPRRQTYLVQRRKIFSSTSLQEASNKHAFDLSKKKTILLSKDNKETSRAETRRSLFLNADEQKKRRLEALKRSPGKVKALWMQRNLPKKATPRKSTPKKFGGTSSQRTPKKATTPKKSATPRKQTTPRRLRTPRKSKEYRRFNANGKRPLSDEDACNDVVSSHPANSDYSKRETNTSSDMTHTHRRKLLWAVSAALGKVGIKQGHLNFRSYGKRLFRTCKLLWTNPSTERAMNSSTSEQMLSLASEQLPAVMKEVDDMRKPENPDLFNQDSWDCFTNPSVEQATNSNTNEQMLLSMASEQPAMIKEMDETKKSENPDLVSQDSNSRDCFTNPSTEQAINSSTNEQMLLSMASEQPAMIKELDKMKKSENLELVSQDSNSRDCFTNPSTEQAINSSTNEQMLLSMASEQPAMIKEMDETKKSENPDLVSQDSKSRDCFTNLSTEQAINSSTNEQMLLSMASEQPAMIKEMEETKKSENPDLVSQDSNSWNCFTNPSTEQAINSSTNEQMLLSMASEQPAMIKELDETKKSENLELVSQDSNSWDFFADNDA